MSFQNTLRAAQTIGICTSYGPARAAIHALCRALLVCAALLGGIASSTQAQTAPGTPGAAPQIQVSHGGAQIASGATIDLGQAFLKEHKTTILTIVNTGNAPLNLTGSNPTVAPNTRAQNVSGYSSSGYVQQILQPGASITVKVGVSPKTGGQFSVGMRILSDSASDNEFTLKLQGLAVADTEKPKITQRGLTYDSDPGNDAAWLKVADLVTISDNHEVAFSWFRINGVLYGGPKPDYATGLSSHRFLPGTTEVTAYAQDRSGNLSSLNFNVKINDKNPPQAPQLRVYTGAQYGNLPVGVSGEFGTTALVTFPDGSTVTGPVRDRFGYDGDSVSGMINGNVTAQLTDAAGNKSAVTTKVYIDTFAPHHAQNVKITQNPNGTYTITGNAEPNATVIVTWGDGSTDSTKVNSKDTEFSIATEGSRPSGRVRVQVVDVNKNAGNNADVGSVSDTVAPPTPQAPTIKSGAYGVITVRGSTEPGATVTISFPDGSQPQVKAGKDGSYSLVSAPGQPNGSVSVTAKDASGNTSQSSPSARYADTTPPETPRQLKVLPVNGFGVIELTLKAETGAKITVTFPDGTTQTKTVPQTDPVTFTSEGGQPSGDVTVQITDVNGNATPRVVMAKYLDTQTPSIPHAKLTVNADGSLTFAGVSEPYAT